jgi:hypothetical protein
MLDFSQAFLYEAFLLAASKVYLLVLLNLFTEAQDIVA